MLLVVVFSFRLRLRAQLHHRLASWRMSVFRKHLQLFRIDNMRWATSTGNRKWHVAPPPSPFCMQVRFLTSEPPSGVHVRFSERTSASVWPKQQARFDHLLSVK